MGTVHSLSVKRPAIEVHPDFSALEGIRSHLSDIGLVNKQTAQGFLNRFLIKSEVMAIPSIKRLLWVLDIGLEVRQPILIMREDQSTTDRLIYVAFQGDGHQKFVFCGDQQYGPYQFVKIDREGNNFQIRVWRNQEMYYLWPNERGSELFEFAPPCDW